jgi:hypothetical protein
MPSEDTRINSIPIPKCCEEQRARPTIMAMIDFGDDDDTSLLEPKWFVARLKTFDTVRYHEDRNAIPSNEPRFCPYCGTQLPRLVRKKKPPKKLCRVVDGGFYCDNCKERLNECSCYPPEAAWEVEE